MTRAEPIRVGVLGAAGRMGATVCHAVESDPGLELVAAVDPHGAGGDVAGLTIAGDTAALEEAGAEVAVDFTVLDAARANLAWCAEHGIHAVVGTTGFTEDDHAALHVAFTRSNCLIAPNFAIGAVLDDALRRAGGPVLRDGRDHRAAPRQQGRRAVGDGDDDGPADGGGVRRLGARSDRPARSSAARAAALDRRASTSTRYGCAAWSPTRRCCWGRSARA